MTEPKVNGSQFLYNDLSRRLIRLILESAPDTDPMVDVELRLVALIRERECLAARVVELEGMLGREREMHASSIRESMKRAARVEELEHRIDELESMWPDQSRLTAENTCLAARVQELEDGYVKCVVNRAELQIENTRLREALEKIRDQDYRGNRPWSATVAYDALEEKS